jgi:thiamine-monophosphate kinase
MDVSDGLVGDLVKLCRVSGVGAEIDAGAVPLSPAARAAIARHPDMFRTALTGGDDYEVLFTLPVDALNGMMALGKDAGIGVTSIGRIVAGQGARFLRDGISLDLGKGSFSHF